MESTIKVVEYTKARCVKGIMIVNVSHTEDRIGDEDGDFVKSEVVKRLEKALSAEKSGGDESDSLLSPG
mgnify:CR=1 FL=1